MAYPYEYYKLTFGGEIYGGGDEWSCGLNFGFPNRAVGFEEGDVTAAMEDISEALETFFTSATTLISSNATLNWIKLAGIGKDGLYFREPVIYDYTTPPRGSGSTKPAPQLALAVTFRSSKMRAPGKDARIFLPLPAVAVENDGKITMSSANAVAVNATTLIQDIETAFLELEDEKPQLIVASQKTPVNNVVQTVRVGRMIDTQRRRRNKFSEDYSPANIITRS